ncbi:MAG: hypothetical protein J6Z28_02275, partial [Succinivibrio sp.]|nr:hypothetical protein [Succinivibrio sp.]
MVDFTALNTFKNVDLGNDNAIVNINDDKQLTSDSTFSKAKIFRFLRSSTTQANNNQIRTELLKSLGKAFGLEQGIGTGPKGEVTFSREFMDRLEKILGPAFKRSDFGVPAEGGAVKSGKPLTQRRINLIMTQAAAFESKDFSIASYKNKLSVIMKDLGMPDTVGMKKTDLDVKFKDNPVARIFADIQRSLDFLENELDTAIKNDEGFEFYLETAANEEERETIINNTDKKFLMKDPNSGEYIKYSNVEGSGFRDAILWPKLGGELIHTERAKFRPETSTDIKPLKDYIANTIKAFVKNGIDCYMEAKMSGKMNQFVDHVTHKVGACMEDKGKNFIEFRQKHLEEGVVDKKLE